MKAKQLNVLVVGTVNIESQFFIEGSILSHQTNISSAYTQIFGSKSLNAARTLAKLGSKVEFIGRVNVEDESSFKNFLSKHKINANYLEIDSDSPTGRVTVITDKEAEATQTIFPGANLNLEGSTFVNFDFSKYDAIYSVTTIPLDVLYNLINLANQNKVPIYLDFPSNHQEIIKDILSKADFVMPNRREAAKFLNEEISPIDAINKIRAYLDSNIIITLDKEGSIHLDKHSDQGVIIPIELAKKPVDTTAAGDIFRAAFVYYHLSFKDIPKAINEASRLSTWSVSIKGVDNTLLQITSK